MLHSYCVFDDHNAGIFEADINQIKETKRLEEYLSFVAICCNSLSITVLYAYGIYIYITYTYIQIYIYFYSS